MVEHTSTSIQDTSHDDLDMHEVSSFPHREAAGRARLGQVRHGAEDLGLMPQEETLPGGEQLQSAE